jgi:hypothetical protein
VGRVEGREVAADGGRRKKDLNRGDAGLHELFSKSLPRSVGFDFVFDDSVGRDAVIRTDKAVGSDMRLLTGGGGRGGRAEAIGFELGGWTVQGKEEVVA